jgi:ADP-heptose:LPS heptosyltransferase
MSEKIILHHKWALGDTVLLSGLVRDLHAAYPGRYTIGVETNFTNVWWNNPYVTKVDIKSHPAPRTVVLEWGAAMHSGASVPSGKGKQKKHILAWYHHHFEQQTGVHVPVRLPRADLWLSEEESVPRVSGRYWVVLSGGKLDVTIKHWHRTRMQEVVNTLADYGIPCVQLGSVCSNHIHPPLENAVNLLGKTENARDMWNIIKYADGVICGITAAMHIAAAYERPCVVLGGGREEPWFEEYSNTYGAFGDCQEPVRVPHRYLHTLGQLDCCQTTGCWRKRVVPLDPEELHRKARFVCKYPVNPLVSHEVAKCMDMITTEQVVDAVLSYYVDGTLTRETPPDSKALLSGRTPELVREPSTEERQQQPHQQTHPQALTTTHVTVKKKLDIMDHPTIGGKLTVCVLCYGPHTDLAKKCLTSLLNSVPAERLDIRVATNMAAQSTIDYLHTLPLRKLYINSENRFKYPVMREMFNDPACPITTPYLLWLDDDTYVVRPDWLSNLCDVIVRNHQFNYRMYGSPMYHDLSMYAKHGHRPDLWFRQASWNRGVPFRVRGSNRAATNGSVIDFAVGWCWALHTETMRIANIPDPRLQHNGGDITIGAQLQQAGYRLHAWNKGKEFIACPSREQGGRRGYSEAFPWTREKFTPVR